MTIASVTSEIEEMREMIALHATIEMDLQTIVLVVDVIMTALDVGTETDLPIIDLAVDEMIETAAALDEGEMGPGMVLIVALAVEGMALIIGSVDGMIVMMVHVVECAMIVSDVEEMVLRVLIGLVVDAWIMTVMVVGLVGDHGMIALVIVIVVTAHATAGSEGTVTRMVGVVPGDVKIILVTVLVSVMPKATTTTDEIQEMVRKNQVTGQPMINHLEGQVGEVDMYRPLVETKHQRPHRMKMAFKK